ncbi:hypothetical protein [Acanthopleuribacter pedis]|uniref:Uncharacterized protein n=1 Tax=Acanthopleuribacter pedis TaxID=442870 RepID=A0A8J7U4D6_9BACT|nr:hypothetical protein [Acanthopleuribacter pedis]MBO1321378.1 hypothetical protein [Acanthopleuribacter pedis]
MSKPSPVFAQDGDSALYFWDGSKRGGYRRSPGFSAGSQVSLTASLADHGAVWFWCDTDITDGAAFGQSLETWLERQPPAAQRLVWIQDADADPTRWRTTLVATAVGPHGGLSVWSGALFDWNGVKTTVSAGCKLATAEKNELYGLTLTFEGKNALRLQTEDGVFIASEGLAGVSYSPYRGGCLVWNTTLAAAVAGTASPMQKLGVSQRFFAPDREARDGTVTVLRTEPLIQPVGGDPITLYASMDPFRPLDRFSSRLSLYLTHNHTRNHVVFETGFAQQTGQGIHLTARVPKLGVNEAPGFVLAVQPLVCGDPGSVPVTHYFTPDGDFHLTALKSPRPEVRPSQEDPRAAEPSGVPAAQPSAVPAAQPSAGSAARRTPNQRLLCGMNGAEYVGFPDENLVLWFRAGHAAYAPDAGAAPTTAVAAARLQFGVGEGAGTDAEPAPAAPWLTELGTTAWLWFTGPDKNIHYYAQSEAALFYAAASDAFLSFFEMPTALLHSYNPDVAFPMLGYAGLPAARIPLAQVLENEAIAPARLQRITALTPNGNAQPAGGGTQPAAADQAATRQVRRQVTPPGDNQAVVSPSGLTIGYGKDDAPWDWLGIGNTGSNDDGAPDLFFTAVQGPFRDALMSNNLFMVLGDADTLMRSASVAYQLSQNTLALMADLPDQDPNWNAVVNAVAAAVAAHPKPYKTESEFNAMLDGVQPKPNPAQQDLFRRYGGLLTAVVGDWTFRLSPRNWTGVNRDTRLIFKFVTDRGLRALVDDTSAWLWPEAAGAHQNTVRNQILRQITDAEGAVRLAEARGDHSPYANFVDVVHDPAWTGVLALNGEVPLTSLPEPLQPLAAGIDPALFQGHHLGFATTGFKPDGKGGLTFDVSASFGLIDYQDPIDQTFDSDTVNFAFKVQELTVAFANGLTTDFTATAQLLVNRLFGTQTELTPTAHGNNLMLDGVYQEQSLDGGTPRGTYLFRMRDPGVMRLSMGQLSEVAVDSVRMAVVRACDPEADVTTVQTLFQMDGRLRFKEPGGFFDPFCWGPVDGTVRGAEKDALALDGDARDKTKPEGVNPKAEVPEGSRGLLFANYAISMAFPLADPRDLSFGIVDDNLSLDTAHSPAREDALFARFPLRLVDLISSPDPWITEGIPPTTNRDSDPRLPEPLRFSPESAGYVSIAAPLRQGRLSAPWFGLVYELDVGTLGALAGSMGITLRMIAAWSPGAFENAPAVFLGLALPGVSEAVGMNLPLQGMLDLGFRTAQFECYRDDKGVQYLLRLRDFAVRVLGWSFPPGHNDIILFGNPDQSADTKLGWYAAFEDIKVKEKGKTKKRQETRLVRASRPARIQQGTGEAE